MERLPNDGRRTVCRNDLVDLKEAIEDKIDLKIKVVDERVNYVKKVLYLVGGFNALANIAAVATNGRQPAESAQAFGELVVRFF